MRVDWSVCAAAFIKDFQSFNYGVVGYRFCPSSNSSQLSLHQLLQLFNNRQINLIYLMKLMRLLVSFLIINWWSRTRKKGNEWRMSFLYCLVAQRASGHNQQHSLIQRAARKQSIPLASLILFLLLFANQLSFPLWNIKSIITVFLV